MAGVRRLKGITMFGVVLGAMVGLYLTTSNVPLLPQAQTAGGKVESSTGTASDRYAYYPGSEELPASDVERAMLKDHADKYNIDLKKFQ